MKALARIVALVGLLIAATASAAAPVVGERERARSYRNGLVAFVRCCGPETGIYVIEPNGRGERRIYTARHDDAPLNPAWSPKGTQIAFVPGAPAGGVWTMEADGSRRHRIVRGSGDALFPSWSSSGRAIIFADLQSPRSGFHDLYVVQSSGRGLKQLTRTAADELQPAWAPNGREIVYDRGRDLWRMQVNGSRQRLLTRNASSASWSPGGTRIAFIRAGDPWVMARDGSGAKRITDLESAQLSLAWSPDSRWLVTAPIDRGNLLLVRTDGSQTVPLTSKSGYAHAWPMWQRR